MILSKTSAVRSLISCLTRWWRAPGSWSKRRQRRSTSGGACRVNSTWTKKQVGIRKLNTPRGNQNSLLLLWCSIWIISGIQRDTLSVFYPCEGSISSRHVRGCEHHVTATPFPHRNILRGVAVGSILFVCKTLFRIEILGPRTASPQIKPFSIALNKVSIFNLISSQRHLAGVTAVHTSFWGIIVKQDLRSSTAVVHTPDASYVRRKWNAINDFVFVRISCLPHHWRAGKEGLAGECTIQSSKWHALAVDQSVNQRSAFSSCCSRIWFSWSGIRANKIIGDSITKTLLRVPRWLCCCTTVDGSSTRKQRLTRPTRKPFSSPDSNFPHGRTTTPQHRRAEQRKACEWMKENLAMTFLCEAALAKAARAEWLRAFLFPLSLSLAARSAALLAATVHMTWVTT